MLESISSSLNSAKKNLSEVAESTRRTLFSIRTTPIDKKTAAATALVAAAVTGAAGTASYVVIPAIANYLNPPPPPSFFEQAISAVKSLASNFTGAQAPGLGMAALFLLVGITKEWKEEDFLKEEDSPQIELKAGTDEDTDDDITETPPPRNDSERDIYGRRLDPEIPPEDRPSSSRTGTGDAPPALNPSPTIPAIKPTEPREEASGVPVGGAPIPPSGVPASPLPVEDAADRSPVPFSEQGAQPPTVQIPEEPPQSEGSSRKESADRADALHKEYVRQIEEDDKRPTEITIQKSEETGSEIPDRSEQGSGRQRIKRTHSTPETRADSVTGEEGHQTDEDIGSFRKRRQAPPNPDGVHTLKRRFLGK